MCLSPQTLTQRLPNLADKVSPTTSQQSQGSQPLTLPLGSHCRLLRSHTRAVLSALPVTMVLPSGLNTRLRTRASACGEDRVRNNYVG